MADAVAPPEVEKGVCYALFAYEVGLSIDLDECERRMTALTERVTLRHKRRAPRYFEYRPPPLRVMQEGEPIAVGAQQTAAPVDVLVFDFGAVSVTYEIPFTGPLAGMQALSDALYDHPGLLADSRRRVEQLLAAMDAAVQRPGIADVVEPYAIFQIGAFARPCPPEALYTLWAEQVAQILRAEAGPLSQQEIADALACRLSFGPDDLVVIDWDASHHLHLVVEARDARTLSRGLHGLAIRVARAVNRVLGRRGALWGDRYHSRALTTPRAVRNALVYVLMNFRKYHGGERGLDPCSSAQWFDGWRTEVRASPPSPSPITRARTWLAAIGWRRHGLIGLDERPRT